MDHWPLMGRWTVTPGETAAYRTRVLVRYPEDPEAFDGTVWVEWYNVTGGIDNDPDFGLAHPAMLDAGSAFVGVSAQAVGIEGGGPSIDIEGAPEISGLKESIPSATATSTTPETTTPMTSTPRPPRCCAGPATSTCSAAWCPST